MHGIGGPLAAAGATALLVGRQGARSRRMWRVSAGAPGRSQGHVARGLAAGEAPPDAFATPMPTALAHL